MSTINVRDPGSKAIVTKGKYIDKMMTVDSHRLTYYGHLDDGTTVGPYLPMSIKDVVPAPPPPPPPPPPSTIDLGPVPTGIPVFDSYTWAQTGTPIPDRGRWGPWEDCQQWVNVGYGNTDTSVAKLKLVPSPVFPGKLAIEAWVGESGGKAGQRAEFGDWGDIQEGTTDVIADVLFIPSSNKTIGWQPGNHDLFQFGHPGSAAPIYLFDLRSGGGWDQALYLLRNGSNVAKFLPGDAMYDKPLPVVFKFKWSRGGDGRFEAWFGSSKLCDISGPTLMTQTASMKQGLYGTSDGNRVICHGHRRWRL